MVTELLYIDFLSILNFKFFITLKRTFVLKY